MATIRSRIRELVDDVVDRAYTIRLSSIATIGARELLDFGLAVLVSTIGLELLVDGEIGLSLLPFVLVVVAPFWIATLALRAARRRFALVSRIRAVASGLFAVALGFLAFGIYQLLEFLVPFLGAELAKTSQAGYGAADTFWYVAEGVVWSVPMVLAIDPGMAGDFELGLSALGVGLALEGSWRGLSRLDRRRRE